MEDVGERGEGKKRELEECARRWVADIARQLGVTERPAETGDPNRQTSPHEHRASTKCTKIRLAHNVWLPVRL